MRRFVCLLVCLLGLFALSGFAAEAEARLSVVATDFPCYDFVRQTAGELAEVKLLIRPGAEVHTYEPSPADIIAIQSADLFVYIGGESDTWAEELLSSMKDGPRVLRLMDTVELREEEGVSGSHLEAQDGEEAEYDEHIWTSPKNAQMMVEAIRDALKEADPEDAGFYDENAEEYLSALQSLDERFSQVVAEGARREIVFGDRFPFLYFVREYGLDYYAAFPGCSSAAEPSAQTVANLIDRVRKDAIPVVYILELSNGKIAQTIAGETGAEVLTMYSCQTISLEDFEAGETYLTLMERNVEALRRGLN